mgnify:CR=1 FL=1
MTTETSPRTDDTRTAVLGVLTRLEARHANRSAWCQGAYARSKTGRAVNFNSRRVVATCLLGGFEIETREQLLVNVCVKARELLLLAARDLFKNTLMDINDIFGYDAVRAVERRAVELAEAELSSTTAS